MEYCIPLLDRARGIPPKGCVDINKTALEAVVFVLMVPICLESFASDTEHEHDHGMECTALGFYFLFYFMIIVVVVVVVDVVDVVMIRTVRE